MCSAVETLEILAEREQRARRVVRFEEGGHGSDLDRRCAESLELEPELLELARAADECLKRRRGELDEHRHEQALRLEAAGCQLLHHALEQHTLVRHVLIDNRDPLVIHRNDERVAELPERNHRADVYARSGF